MEINYPAASNGVWVYSLRSLKKRNCYRYKIDSVDWILIAASGWELIPIMIKISCFQFYLFKQIDSARSGQIPRISLSINRGCPFPSTKTLVTTASKAKSPECSITAF